MSEILASTVMAVALLGASAEPAVLVHGSEVRERKSADGATRMRVVFDPEQTEDSPTYLGLGVLEPGGGVPEHRHDRQSEVIYVVRGEGVLVLEGRDIPFRAGDALRIPPGRLHSFCNTGSDPVELVQTFFPPKRSSRVRKPAAAPTPSATPDAR